jgi:hypothetical protein
MGSWSGIEQWWVRLNAKGGRGWMMVAGGGEGDAVAKVGDWERKWLFVDNVFVVDNIFVLHVPQKTGHCLVLQTLKS